MTSEQIEKLKDEVERLTNCWKLQSDVLKIERALAEELREEIARLKNQLDTDKDLDKVSK